MDFTKVGKTSRSFESFFDVIVSNPPYQRETGSGSVAVYHDVMNIAKLLANKISMIYPMRWIVSGRGVGIADFRKEELVSPLYKKFFIESGSSTVFEHVIIKGGVNYFLWDKNNTHDVEYYYNKKLSVRKNLQDDNTVMILDPDFSSIVSKVDTHNALKPFSRNYYGTHLETDYKVEKLQEEFLKLHDKNDGLKNYYSGMSGGLKVCYLSKTVTVKNVDCWKVLASRTADASGYLKRLNRLFLAEPFEICSGSFVVVKEFTNEREAINCIHYLKTVFVRFLLGVVTVTSDVKPANYALVPDIDFANGRVCDADNKFLNFDSVETLDEQLFHMYDIDKEERELMMRSVKPWRDQFSVNADGLF